MTEQLSLSAYFHFQGGENLYMFRESVKSAIGNIKEVLKAKKNDSGLEIGTF